MTTYANAAAVRAFRIMEILAKADKPLSLSEITRKIELPKQSVHRLLKQLEGAWLVTRVEPSKNYECSSRVRKMAINLLMTVGPSAARRAILQELADEISHTCNLTISSGDDIVYLDRVEVNWPTRMLLEAGSRVPLHCTASGKLLLSFLPKQQRERLLKQLPLRSETGKTITELEALRNELKTIRRRRYSTNRGEFLQGMIAVAVPVFLNSGRACAAVAIQSCSKNTSLTDLTNHVPLLQDAATRISETFL